MTEARREIDPAHISPSNGRKEGRGFWHPFSSNRTYLAPAQHVMAQAAKEADEKRPHKNSMPQRILYLVKKHPFEIPMMLAGIGLASYAIYEEAPSLFKDNNNPSSSTDIDSVGPTSFNDKRLQDLPPQPEQAKPVNRVDNNPQSAPKPETKKINPEEVFDNTATKGIKSEGNTIQMTREEYEKIAPPAIDRTNLKVVPVTLNIPPRSDGRTTRSLTLEQGTSVNTMIYVKTPDGNIREVSKTKIANPGGGSYPTFVFPNCRTLVGLEGEIQAGDTFPASITGRVYYQGRRVENGIGGNYVIEGQYYDEKTGKTFKTIAYVNMLYTITQPLKNIPNLYDEAFKEKARGIDSSGKEVEVMVTNKDKIPVVMVQQGEDLFKFVTKPSVQNFSRDFETKSQLVVSTSYQGDFGENGIANTFGGENCNHATVDNKEIVLK